ncbi:MAG: hypothetical protein GYA23_02020 [Methanomicrobiales archaeon]|nr:hypothetical protein [Methanomicrobiales archaeon]
MGSIPMTAAVQALWLQYRGLTLESARTMYRIENAAWNLAPPQPDEEPEIVGLMIAL